MTRMRSGMLTTLIVAVAACEMAQRAESQAVTRVAPVASAVRAVALPISSTTAEVVGRKRGSAPRIVGQVIGATFGAALAGSLAYAIFDRPKDSPGCHKPAGEGTGFCPNANTAFAVGSFLGSTAVVQWIGRGDGSRGSLAWTAIGTGIPTVPMLLGRNEEGTATSGLVFGSQAQAILGTIGYQATRIGKR